MLAEDIRVREYLKKKLKSASVGRVIIERPAKNARITVYSARPGVVIGKRGEDIEKLRKECASRNWTRSSLPSRSPSSWSVASCSAAR
ncbi:hypothetical protein G6F24_018590 [Rhizopus arrhizus]|nr:hypothetical protein G6F24_018590 [Rhizopus arrhizus]